MAEIDAEIKRLDRTTYAAAEAEVAFADNLVSAYATTVFSALPAGTFENGRSMRRQPQPQVELPEWARVLAPAEPEEE